MFRYTTGGIWRRTATILATLCQYTGDPELPNVVTALWKTYLGLLIGPFRETLSWDLLGGMTACLLPMSLSLTPLMSFAVQKLGRGTCIKAALIGSASS